MKKCIETFTGKLIDPFQIDPKDISILDIAVGIAHTNRFGGHTVKPYTVAEHCIALSYIIEYWGEQKYTEISSTSKKKEDFEIEKFSHLQQDWDTKKFEFKKEDIAIALLHDASESYIGDIPSPLKHQFVGLIEAEDVLINKIFKKYISTDGMSELVHFFDKAIVILEARLYKPNRKSENWPYTLDSRWNEFITEVLKTVRQKIIVEYKHDIVMAYLDRVEELLPGTVPGNEVLLWNKMKNKYYQ